MSEALTRELYEELGIEVVKAEPLLQVRHEYPDKAVFLDVWVVESFLGCARGREGQPIVWARCEDLGNYGFPDANKAIIKAVENLLQSSSQ